MTIASIDESARRRFESAWVARKPVTIESCLPPADSPAWLPTLEELVLIEIEFGWKADHFDGPLVEDYLSRFPQLLRADITLRLLQQEFEVRQLHGDRPAREQYVDRFPDLIITGEELRAGKTAPLASMPVVPADATQISPADVRGAPSETAKALSGGTSPGAGMQLLFAVLALQMEYLDLNRFTAACRAWAADKSVPLANLLVERGWITPQARDELTGAVERKLKRFGGDPNATLGAAADVSARDAIRSIDDSQVRAVVDHLPPPAGQVLLETVAHEPAGHARYTLTRLHAEGGLGRVWIARDGDLNRDVALKELKPSIGAHPEASRRFLKEAQVTGQLEHPNIVPVYELGRRPNDNQPFYTMRFVHGQTLRDAAAEFHKRRRDGLEDPVEWLRLLQAFVSICNAVSYAHSRGVIHRDLKPDNVVLGGFGEVLVLDWGLAKTGETKDERITPVDVSKTVASIHTTVSGRILGTPAYMAPEQAEGRLDLVDERTDVYGLGAILFEILTGRPPHLHGDTSSIIEQIIKDPTPPARSVNSATPKALEAICLAAMAKQRMQRYPAADELSRDVERYLADEPVAVYREPLTIRMGRFVRRHRTKVAFAAAAVLVALVSAGIGLMLFIESENRAAAETDARMGRLMASVQSDRDLAVNELKKGNFGPVDELLDRAAGKLANDRNRADVDARPAMVALRTEISTQHERLHRINQFYQYGNEAERLAFFEDDDRAEDASLAALNLFKALDDPKWWEHLPVDELTLTQRDQLQEDVFGQLIFLAALRAKRGLMNIGDPSNEATYRAALKTLEAASRWKPSESARLLDVLCRVGLGLKEVAKLGITKPIEPSTAADNYFLGIMYFWVSQMNSDAISVLLKAAQPLTGVDFSNALDRSERLLRRSASMEPNHYWTYFWLGWNRLAGKHYASAELAFDSCIALHPDNALGFAYRGWSLLLEAQTLEDKKVQAELRERGLSDLAHSRSIEPTNPEFAWLTGIALAQAGQVREALQAYQRALDLEPPLAAWRGRRIYAEKELLIKRMAELAKKQTETDPRNPDGWAALASASFELDNFDEADQAAAKALSLRADQPLALAIRGSTALAHKKFDAALADFRAVFAKQPKSWPAAYGFAMATESQGTPEQALDAFDWLAKIAATDWQKVESQLGRARVLSRLNRNDEAAEALKAAQSIDPRAGKPN